jgi:hypothetical protein
MTAALTQAQILKLFHALNEELGRQGVSGEVYVVGGAVMCLAMRARQSTRDVDALFAPAPVVRQAAERVADALDVDKHWLNDAVKGFLSPKGEFNDYLDLSHLRVLLARPEYLLAMKCLSMRLGAEFQDERDIQFLLRYLNIDEYDQAVATVSRYYPLERFPQKTLYALEEMLGPTDR